MSAAELRVRSVAWQGQSQGAGTAEGRRRRCCYGDGLAGPLASSEVRDECAFSANVRLVAPKVLQVPVRHACGLRRQGPGILKLCAAARSHSRREGPHDWKMLIFKKI